MTSPENQTGKAPFTFVIPVVHPDGPKVKDYAVVERALALTITSLLSQSAANTRVVVVCHQLPDWHVTCPATVKFLLVGDHPRFTANVRHRHQDKGMKFLAGIWFAYRDHDPALIMPMDADDFVRRDIASAFTDIAQENEDKDLFLISTGYHVALRNVAQGFEVLDAFELERFDETCGTCRVFNSRNFRRKLISYAPDITNFELPDVSHQNGMLNPGFLDQLVSIADQDADNPHSFIYKIGDHTWQGKMFNLLRVYEAFAAKGCGHGNHVSGKKLSFHSLRLQKRTSIEKFMAEFGIAETNYLRPSFSLNVRLFGLASVLYNKIRM